MRDDPSGLSDRELDACVGREIFGWDVRRSWLWGFVVRFNWLESHNHLPALSATWEGVGMIVEALKARGLYIDIRTFADFDQAVVTASGAGYVTDAHALGAPRAVAIASIRAVRILTKARDSDGDDN
jgi:hypothetical protein